MKELIIEPGKAEKQYWRDIWSYRELFYFLAWRNILVRYKQTIIGVAWSVLRPLLTMIVLTVVFGSMAKLPSATGVPYPILVYCAMLPWQFFAGAVTESGNSIVGNSNMVSKIYFPRIIIPVSSIITSAVDALISAALLVMVMLYYGFTPSPWVALIPVFSMIAFAASVGVGLWISALMVRYRDFRFITPFIVQFGLYISPVGFSSSVVPEQWRLLYSLNPMVGVIDGFRWAIIGGEYTIYVPGMILSLFVVLLTIVTGIIYFRKTERTFADVI